MLKLPRASETSPIGPADFVYKLRPFATSFTTGIPQDLLCTPCVQSVPYLGQKSTYPLSWLFFWPMHISDFLFSIATQLSVLLNKAQTSFEPDGHQNLLILAIIHIPLTFVWLTALILKLLGKKPNLGLANPKELWNNPLDAIIVFLSSMAYAYGAIVVGTLFCGLISDSPAWLSWVSAYGMIISVQWVFVAQAAKATDILAAWILFSSNLIPFIASFFYPPPILVLIGIVLFTYLIGLPAFHAFTVRVTYPEIRRHLTYLYTYPFVFWVNVAFVLGLRDTYACLQRDDEAAEQDEIEVKQRWNLV